MKKIALLIMTSICLYNCSDMNDLHQDYLDRGEKTYTEKVDSLIGFTGKNRVELQWFLLSDLSIEKARVYWNKRKDSMDFDIAVTPNVRDKYNVIVDNLKEDSYIFEVFTLDASGNISVPQSRSIRVLGDLYLSNLDNRVISSHRFVDPDYEFTMSTNIPEDYIRSEIQYYDTNGNLQAIHLFPDSDKDPETRDKFTISDFDSIQSIKFRSVYLPNGNSIDEFTTEFQEYALE